MVSTQLGNMRARRKNPGDPQKVRLSWSTINQPDIRQIHTSGSQFYALNDSNPNRIRVAEGSHLKVISTESFPMHILEERIFAALLDTAAHMYLIIIISSVQGLVTPWSLSIFSTAEFESSASLYKTLITMRLLACIYKQYLNISEFYSN